MKGNCTNRHLINFSIMLEGIAVTERVEQPQFVFVIF